MTWIFKICRGDSRGSARAQRHGGLKVPLREAELFQSTTESCISCLGLFYRRVRTPEGSVFLLFYKTKNCVLLCYSGRFFFLLILMNQLHLVFHGSFRGFPVELSEDGWDHFILLLNQCEKNSVREILVGLVICLYVYPLQI